MMLETIIKKFRTQLEALRPELQAHLADRQDLSTLLDRLLSSLQESRHAVHHGDARATLDTLASMKKSSVARARAQALLALAGPAGQPPPEVAAILALVEGEK